MTLSVEVADDVSAAVHLDSEKVAWALTTLVGNVLRYVRSGSRRMPGKIPVRTSYDRATSEVTIWKNGHTLNLIVFDDSRSV